MASVEIVAGEMRLWSDRGNPRRPAAGGPVAIDLVRRALGSAPGNRVALVGPHGDDLIAALREDGHELTLVVRALPDAEALAAAQNDVRLVCGDALAWASTAETFDAVIALDGVERLASNDRPAPARAELLQTLADRVGAEGVLVVAADNPTSLLSLADRRALPERRDTGDWAPPLLTDPSSWRTRQAWTAALAGLGFSVRDYAALWLPAQPDVLLSDAACADVIARIATRRAAAALDGYELHFDPSLPAVERIVTGDAADIATTWVAVAVRSDIAPDLPAGLALDPQGVVRVLIGDRTGTLLVDEAVRLAQREELIPLSTLLSAYLAAVDEGKADGAEDALVEDDHTFPAAGFVAAPVGIDAASHAAAWLAARLLEVDVPEIWPPWMDTSAVARSYLAAAGLERTDGALAAAVDAAASVRPRHADTGSLLAVNERLERELESAKGQVIAHERLATNRDRTLAKRTAELDRARFNLRNERNRRIRLEERIKSVEERLQQPGAEGSTASAFERAARKVQRKLRGE